MWQNLVLAFIGGAAGLVIASGTVAFVISLGMVPRFAGISKTADHIHLYESCCIAGTLGGTILTLCDISIPCGTAGLLIYGLFAGIFLGGWIIALGEVVDIYAILFRRIGLTRGLAMLVLCMAIGKVAGSLIYFYKSFGI